MCSFLFAVYLRPAVLGRFVEFHTRADELRHAYGQLKRVENKPDFEVVHGYITKFIKPFEQEQQANMMWKPNKAEWLDVLP